MGLMQGSRQHLMAANGNQISQYHAGLNSILPRVSAIAVGRREGITPAYSESDADSRYRYRFSKLFCNSSGAIDFTLIGFAGIPPTMWYGDTSFDATPTDPTMPCSPTRTPLSTVA